MGFLGNAAKNAAKKVLDAPGVRPVTEAIDKPLTNAKGRRAHQRDVEAFVRSIAIGRTYYSLHPDRRGYEIVFVRKSRSLGQPITKCGTPASRIYDDFAPLTDQRPHGWKSLAEETREAAYGIGGPNIVGSLHEFADQPKRAKQRA